MMPAYVDAMTDPHEAITEPIVILANCQSVSMSETSTLCLKTLPNGTFIGKRTFGAICPLTGNDDHSFNYAGYIGVDGVTPVYAHLPSMASYTLEKKLIEAEGIHPDIEVDLDIDLFKTTGQDTQLDRALQFIRSGQ
jgi:C-terminal processing protease CtpA/Prc